MGCQLCLTDINLSLPQNPHYAWVASSVSQASTFRSLRIRITLGLPALSHRHQPLAPQNLLNTRIATSVLQTSTFQCQSRKVSFLWLSCRHQPFSTNTLYLIDIYRHLLKPSPRHCLADVNLSAPEPKSIFFVVVLQTSTFRH